ncbi:MAG TPA: hypothetical protein VNN08_04925 [Thermoanaerobaculia bacterium]|nr:hypothetical protein [Thermoanaerobaculia bacterium]
MPIVEIYANGLLIGHGSLDAFDDGMGVASGPFQPSAPYVAVRAGIMAAAEARLQNLRCDDVVLEARAPSGEVISAGFIQIDDFEDVDVDPEVSIQFSDHWQWLRVSGAFDVRRGDVP